MTNLRLRSLLVVSSATLLMFIFTQQQSDLSATSARLPTTESQVASQNNVTLAAGDAHTCALISGGGVRCWGSNSALELGDGTGTNRNKPVDVIGLNSGVRSIAAGEYVSYAILADGSTKWWGRWLSGIRDVTGLPLGITNVDGRFWHACAITQSGGVKCWGSNDTGQLGNGTFVDSDTPVDVVGLSSGVVAIATEGTWDTCGLGCWYPTGHSCAVLDSGGVKCWGENALTGTFGRHSTPVDVVGLQGSASALATDWNGVCALLTSGAVTCWSIYNPGLPSIVPGLGSGVTLITGAGGHYCVLTTDGGVKCWGSNSFGELGNGSYQSSSIPVDVVGLSSGVTEIAAGLDNTCARLGAFGSIKCWGNNSSGQLGNGTFVSSTIPVDVIGLNHLLTLNYTTGQPGSFLTLSGANFSPNAITPIVINGRVITTSGLIDSSGTFTFLLDTSQASVGQYFLTTAYPDAQVSFALDLDMPPRPQEGNAPVLVVPEGIAFTQFMYLPVLRQ